EVMQAAARHRGERTWPKAEKDFLIGLATWLDDDSNEKAVGDAAMAAASGLDPRVMRRAKQSLRARGWIEYDSPSGRGHLTTYRLIRLHDLKADSHDVPLSKADTHDVPLSEEKRTTEPIKEDKPAPKSGQTEVERRTT